MVLAAKSMIGCQASVVYTGCHSDRSGLAGEGPFREAHALSRHAVPFRQGQRLDFDRRRNRVDRRERDGKTNLLLPLWKLNPAGTGGDIQPLADVPRIEYTEMRQRLKDVTFIEAEFSVEEQLAEKLAAISGSPAAELDVLVVSRRFGCAAKGIRLGNIGNASSTRLALQQADVGLGKWCAMSLATTAPAPTNCKYNTGSSPPPSPEVTDTPLGRRKK